MPEIESGKGETYLKKKRCRWWSIEDRPTRVFQKGNREDNNKQNLKNVMKLMSDVWCARMQKED